VVESLDISKLFAVIDEKDTQGFCEFLTPDCIFKFGNMDAVQGRENIFTSLEGFFNSIQGLAHQTIDSWETGNTVICHGTVSYTRLDGSSLTVPVSNIFTMEAGLIASYLIFIDVSELF
jgi:ketosteroid isomerase-like protein